MTTGREPSVGGDKQIDTNGVEPKLGGEAALLHLVEMLEHTDRIVRYRAAAKLVEYGDQRVFDTLVEMLHDPNGTTLLHHRAAEALGKFGGERAIEPLMASTHLYEPFMIIKILARIGGERAVEAIGELFRNHGYNSAVFSSIADVLPDIAGPQVIDFLLEAVVNDVPGPEGGGDYDEAILYHTPGHHASNLLGKLGKLGYPVLDRLLPLLEHESTHTRRLALAALWSSRDDERLFDPLLALLTDENPHIVREAVQLLGALGDQRVILPLIDLLDHENDDVVWTATEFLGRLGDRRAVPHLIRMLDHPGESFHSVAGTAAYSLMELGDPRAVEPLIKALNSPNQHLRTWARFALGKIGGPRSIGILSDGLQKASVEDAEDWARVLSGVGSEEADKILETTMWQHPLAGVCEVVARVLGETKDNRVTDILVKALQHHPNLVVRAEIAALLVEIPDERTTGLIKALDDQDAVVRQNAAVSLGKIGGKQAVDPLIAALQDSQIEVRESAVDSLGEVGDYRAVESLIAALSDDNIGVRSRAAEALGKLGDQRAVEPLIKALLNDPQIGRASAAALGKLGDRRAIEPLLSVVAQGRDLEQVAEALGKLGDWRVVEPLIGILNKFDDGAQEAASALGKLGDARAIKPLTAALYRAMQMREERLENGEHFQASSYYNLAATCERALELIGTPEALTAVEDFVFREVHGQE